MKYKERDGQMSVPLLPFFDIEPIATLWWTWTWDFPESIGAESSLRNG
jgi:hypothetical protein